MENARTQALREQIAKLVDEYAAIALAPQPFLPGLTVVPPSEKVVGAEELKNMVEASLDGWLTIGRFNAEFEKKLAAFIGVRHLITVNFGSSENLAAGNFLRDALAGQSINVQGDGRPLRSYLYMADLCVWLLRILGSGASGQAYNVGSENAVSIAALARQVADAAGTDAAIKVQTTATHDAPAPRYVPDTLKARQELGLAEYTSLHTALLKTIHWSRSTTAL